MSQSRPLSDFVSTQMCCFLGEPLKTPQGSFRVGHLKEEASGTERTSTEPLGTQNHALCGQPWKSPNPPFLQVLLMTTGSTYFFMVGAGLKSSFGKR